MSSRDLTQLSPYTLLAFVVLSTAPEFRIGDVQVLEMLQLLRAGLALLLFVYLGPRFTITGLWRKYAVGYLYFLIAASALSVIALRLPFYPPSEISVLKRPLVLSLSRLVEIALAVYFMLAIANTLRDKPKLYRMALDTYIGVAAVGALCSIAAFAAFKLTGKNTILINELDHRVCGLFNEGGPYGLFLASVMLAFFVRRRLYPRIHPLISWPCFLIVVTAFVLSFSKAGLLALILCTATLAITLKGNKRLIATALVPIGLICFVALFQRGLVGYIDSFLDFDEAAFYRPTDRNLVMGRITAAFVVPRMISAHPILGIGIGNYSLMRNDPDYLQGLPAIDDWDLPGLGLISNAAELGVPLTLILVALLLRPIAQSRKGRAPAIVIVTAAFQPVALLVGVNMNFFYPWLLSAFAMAWLAQSERQREADHLRP